MKGDDGYMWKFKQSFLHATYVRGSPFEVYPVCTWSFFGGGGTEDVCRSDGGNGLSARTKKLVLAAMDDRNMHCRSLHY